jgi:hypothetical protein
MEGTGTGRQDATPVASGVCWALSQQAATCLVGWQVGAAAGAPQVAVAGDLQRAAKFGREHRRLPAGAGRGRHAAAAELTAGCSSLWHACVRAAVGGPALKGCGRLDVHATWASPMLAAFRRVGSTQALQLGRQRTWPHAQPCGPRCCAWCIRPRPRSLEPSQPSPRLQHCAVLERRPPATRRRRGRASARSARCADHVHRAP